MKRFIVGAISFVILTGFTSCGKPPLLPDGGIDICSKDNLQTNPTLCPDRTSLGFGEEFGTGTYIGTKPPETISIRNGGQGALEVSSVQLTGDSAFTMQVSYDAPSGGTGTDLPATIKVNKYMFLQVVFAPTAAKQYNGTITLTSNAANAPTQTFTLSGCGVPADGGTSPCYRDGGRP